MLQLAENDKEGYQESAAAIALGLPLMLEPMPDLQHFGPQAKHPRASKTHYTERQMNKRAKSANRAFALAASRAEMLEKHGPETSENIWPKF